jgi:hypothetical protein
MLTDEEKRVIEEFASYRGADAHGHKLRADALAIYRKYCHPQTFEDAWGDHMAFMSEMDSPCPDYGLRSILRARLRSRSPNGVTLGVV